MGREIPSSPSERLWGAFAQSLNRRFDLGRTILSHTFCKGMGQNFVPSKPPKMCRVFALSGSIQCVYPCYSRNHKKSTYCTEQSEGHCSLTHLGSFITCTKSRRTIDIDASLCEPLCNQPCVETFTIEVKSVRSIPNQGLD